MCVFLFCYLLTPDLEAHCVHRASAAWEVNMHPLRPLPGVADNLWHSTEHISGHIILAHHFSGDKKKSRPDNKPACTRKWTRAHVWLSKASYWRCQRRPPRGQSWPAANFMSDYPGSQSLLRTLTSIEKKKKRWRNNLCSLVFVSPQIIKSWRERRGFVACWSTPTSVSCEASTQNARTDIECPSHILFAVSSGESCNGHSSSRHELWEGGGTKRACFVQVFNDDVSARCIRRVIKRKRPRTLNDPLLSFSLIKRNI